MNAHEQYQTLQVGGLNLRALFGDGPKPTAVIRAAHPRCDEPGQ